MWTDRTKILIGENGLNLLEKANVAVIGVGGVGGYVATMLARCGVGNLTIVDFDTVDETNINRQIVANFKTVGKVKVEVLKEMLLNINPKIKIDAVLKRISKDNLSDIISSKFDYVVDCIDSVADKVELICFCKQNGINIVSAMGAGNRIEIPNFQVVDIYKTCNDGLAKVMRKKLREHAVDSLDVVTSTQLPIKHSQSEVGSIAYQPAMCGMVVSAFVVNKLLKGV